MDKQVNSNIVPDKNLILDGQIDIFDRKKTLANKNLLMDTMKEGKLYLNWNGMRVTNPYFVYKLTSETGMPIEIVREEIEKKGEEWIWTDWCDFWWDSWRKIPEKLLRQ